MEDIPCDKCVQRDRKEQETLRNDVMQLKAEVDKLSRVVAKLTGVNRLDLMMGCDECGHLYCHGECAWDGSKEIYAEWSNEAARKEELDKQWTVPKRRRGKPQSLKVKNG